MADYIPAGGVQSHPKVIVIKTSEVIIQAMHFYPFLVEYSQEINSPKKPKRMNLMPFLNILISCLS